MPCTQKTNHLLKLNFTLEPIRTAIKGTFLVFRFILSFCFSLELGLIFHVWVLNSILVLLVPSIRKFWKYPPPPPPGGR